MTEPAVDPQLNLTLPSGETFDFFPVYVALGHAREFVGAVDVQNAAKNMAPPRLSPLVLALDSALVFLHGLFTEHGTNLDEAQSEPEAVDGELVDA